MTRGLSLLRASRGAGDMKRLLRHPMVDVAIKALGRNRLQTGLTMLGITVGVATVLAMMAVGAGAQRSIEQQVRAAGLNQLTIRAGNWRPKVDDSDEAIAHQAMRASRCRHPLDRIRDDVVPIAFHPEDDPMEKHDHPTARQRLGDLEAGLGSAATMTFADADAIRKMAGVQYVAGGIHENVARPFRREALVHPHARHRRDDAVDQARLDLHRRPLLHRARAESRRAGDRARPGGRRSAVRRRRQSGRPDR